MFGAFCAQSSCQSVNSISNIDRLLRLCCDVMSLDCRRPNETEPLKLWQPGIASIEVVIASVKTALQSSAQELPEAQIDDAVEGGKAKYLSPLESQYGCQRGKCFVLTDSNAKAGKRGEGGEETNGKLLADTCLTKTAKLPRFAKYSKLDLLNFFFCTPKGGYPKCPKAAAVARTKRALILPKK